VRFEEYFGAFWQGECEDCPPKPHIPRSFAGMYRAGCSGAAQFKLSCGPHFVDGLGSVWAYRRTMSVHQAVHAYCTLSDKVVSSYPRGSRQRLARFASGPLPCEEYGGLGATSLVKDATEAALEAVLSDNLSSCESSELPAVSRGEFGGYESRCGKRGRGCAPTPTLKLRQAIWEASHSTGIVFLIFSGYRRRPDAIASFVTERDKEERRWTRSMST
jgi:hypothetical protein